MIMIPHCWHIPAINFDMLYNHSSLGVQVVNPYVVFTEKLMNTIWVKFFESRVQLKYIKPDFADTFVAKVSKLSLTA